MDCGIGGLIIINEEGWFITAGHILKDIRGLDEQVTDTNPKNQRKRNHVIDYVAIIGTTGAQLGNAVIYEGIDFGIGKLKGYTHPPEYSFPTFRTREIGPGEILCRIGYPFIDDRLPTWSKEKGFFFSNLFPLPMFVNEAMVSRFANLNMGTNQNYQWIETSSPGLKGQSGGPLVDPNGYICGIQVNTHHYPLGFQGAGRNQVLNVGRAVHVDSVRKILDDRGIEYLKEEE